MTTCRDHYFLSRPSLCQQAQRFPYILIMSSPHEIYVSGPYSDHQTEATSNLLSNLFPCPLDLISGSSKSAERRRANTQSRKRSRDRKRKAQYAEETKHFFIKQLDDCKDKIAQLMRNIQNLEKHRDHCQNERNLYRHCVFLYTTEDKIPPRPFTPPLDTSQEPAV